MTEKDVVSKTLESYPDVFADIINGFLFIAIQQKNSGVDISGKM